MDVIQKIKNQDGSNLKNAVSRLETAIMETVRNQFSLSWDSDALSESLVKTLCRIFNDRTIHIPGGSITSQWKAYGPMAPQEKIFSSMGIIFNIAYHDHDAVRGAAFLDVHVKDAGKNTFQGIRKDMVRRMHTGAPASQLLLCDYDAISGMAFATSPEYVMGNAPHSWNNWMPVTHAACIPSGLAMALGEKTTSLYKGSLPFSYQLCYRYFYGLDLEYHGHALDIARGEKTDRGIPRFLITVSLAADKGRHAETFDINGSLFREL